MAPVDLWCMRPLLSLACVAVVLAGGCFEAEITVTLRADGSGTQKMRLALGETAVGTLRKAVHATEASASRADPLDVFDAKKVRAELEPVGIELVAHRVFEDKQRQSVELTANFGDLGALRRNPLTGGSRATWEFTPGTTPGQVRLVFFPQGEEAWRAARAKARELAQESDAVVQHFVQARLQAIEGLDVTFSLELPGDVFAHTANLELTGRRSVRVRTRAADVRSATDLLLRLAPRFEIVFGCPDFQFPPALPAEGAPADKSSAKDRR